MHHTDIVALIVIAVICFPAVILFGNINQTAFDIGFYKSFDSSDMQIKQDAVSYLESGEGEIILFSAEEQEHLAEVRSLFQKSIIVFDAAIIVFIISVLLLLYFAQKTTFVFWHPKNPQKDFYDTRNIKTIGTIFIAGGALSLAALFVIYLLTKNWDSAFTSFHQTFFTSRWQFPENSLLIKLFPGSFFYAVFKRILTNILLSSAGVIVLGFFLRKIKEPQL
jgi:hypothetical protein